MNSLKAKIVSTSISIAGIATLIGFGMSSLAWYSNSIEGNTTGIDIKSGLKHDVDIKDNDITIYYYDVQQDKAVIDKNNFILTPYNIFVPARNVYNRKFARMTLRYANGGPNVGDDLNINLKCTGELFKEPGIELEVISNLVQFKFYDNTEGLIGNIGNGVTVQDVYEQCVSVFDNIDTYTTFVSVNDGVASKSANELNVIVDMPSLNTAKDVYTSDFFIEIDYSSDLIEYFKNHSDYDFDLNYFEGPSGIVFEKDISDIVLTIAK